MKNLFIGSVVVLMCLLITGCGSSKLKEVKITTVEIIETNDCNNEAKLYYTEDNYKIYTYCVDKILIGDKNNKYELSEYLKSDRNVIDEIIAKLTVEAQAFDGGTNIYRDNESEKIATGNLTIIKCNRYLENGKTNKDIYIGSQTMDMKEEFCK